MDLPIDTQEPAAVATTEKAPETPAAKEETVEEALGTKVKEVAPPTVGLDKFLELKNDNKELRKDLKALTDKLEAGATKAEVSDDIAAIAEEFGVDKTFLGKLAASIKSQADKDAEDRIASKMAPIEEKERREKIDNAFNLHFKGAIERQPEYAEVANPLVIKVMSLMPENASKTFSQLLEEAYGNSIQGKRTIETTKPGGGKEPQPIDTARATSDPAYYEEIMANPTMKAEYNKGLAKRLGL
jgi:hypothetical protein